MGSGFPDSVVELPTLVELLRWRAQRQPDRRAVTFLADVTAPEAHLEYADLDRQARAIGARLCELGAAGERALLLYPPGLEYIAAFFGCLYAGVIAVPAYPPDPARLERTLPRLRAIAEDARPVVALATAAILPMVELLAAQEPSLRSLRWLATDNAGEDAEASWQMPSIGGDTLAMLQYTSGSTAAPKGVMLTHGNLLHNLAVIRRCFGHTPDSQGVIWLPPYHDMGLIGGILQPIYAGFPVTLMSPMTFLRRPLSWLQAISRERATTSGGPNFAYDLCVRKITPEQRATLDLSSWQVAFTGAEPIRSATLDRFAAAFAPCGFRREAFYPCYGLAEATLIVSGGLLAEPPIVQAVERAALERDRVVEAAADAQDAQMLVGCGRAQPDQQVLIVDPHTCAVCPPDRVGEVWLAGPSVAQGYWAQPEETAQTFRARLSDSGAGPFLRTGDLGFMRAGELFVTGRLKDLIIVRGRNYYPQEIEATVEQCHAALRPGSGAAFAVEVGGEERLVVAQEIYRQQRELDVEAVAGSIRQAVARRHELRVYAVLLLADGSIPKTSSGKIQRRACRAAFLEGTLRLVGSSILEGASEDATTNRPAEEDFIGAALAASEDRATRQALLAAYLRKCVSRALNVTPAQLPVGEPLDRLGLDSLMAVELKNAIETDLGVVVPLTSLLTGPSIDALADELLDRLATPDTPIALVEAAPAMSQLSQGQRALWFLHQLAPESAAYNLSSAFYIRGNLDLPALRESFQSLVERHESLRTTFPTVDGQPGQLVHERLDVFFDVCDAAGWDDAQLDARLDAQAERPFDLERGPLLRVYVFSHSQHEHVLLLTMHHIVTDFWSLVLLLDELRLLYAATKAAVSPSLPPLKLRYADYVRWQTELLASAEGAQLWSYWRAQLAGRTDVLELPSDRQRPLIQTYRGAAHAFALGAELTGRLAALARQRGATLYTVLVAAFQVLLYRYTGQDDLLIGSPAAGRTRAALADLVGYFVNPVVLRADLSGNPAFVAFLARVRETVLAALEHQDYPFPMLVDQLKPERDPSRSPLFQVMFVLEKPHRRGAQDVVPLALGSPGARMALADLTLETCALRQHVAQFDLTLTMEETNQGLLGVFKYNADLFHAATIARMAGHLRVLLDGILAAPERRLSDLPLLTAAERRQVLVLWNDTQAHFVDEDALCIHRLFEVQADRTPDGVAVVFDGQTTEDQRPKRPGDTQTRRHADRKSGNETATQSSVLSPQSSSPDTQHLTYCELDRRTNQLARHLRALGVRSEARVAICVERSLETVAGFLGILKAGGAYVPLDPAYPSERLAFMLEDAQAQVLLTQREIYDLRFTIYDLDGDNQEVVQPAVVCLDRDWEQIAQHDDDRFASLATADNLAYVMYTSGSTGRPKGVLLAHRGICNRVLWMRELFGLNERDSVLQKASFGFDASVWESFLPLFAGARLVVAQPGGHQENAYLVDLIGQQRITTLHFVPSTLQLFLEQPGLDACASVRRVWCGGEALSAALQRRFFARLDADLFNGYGPTEASINAAYWRCERASEHEVVPIGRPLANYQLYILDPQLQPTPIGVPGELHIGGIGLARGYLNRPELTAERFVPNPFGIGDWGLGIGDAETRRHGDTESRGKTPTQSSVLSPQPSALVSVLSPQSSARLYRTGDRARYLADGNIEFLGRLDQQVKLRGVRIEPGEIEAALRQHPAVREAAVIVWEASSGEWSPSSKRLVAYVVPNAECRMQNAEARSQKPELAGGGDGDPAQRTLHSDELRGFLKEKLPAALIPAVFMVVEALPLTPSGKLDRRALPAPDRFRPEPALVAPGTPAEQLLAGIWADVLGLAQVGVHENFFELGGDSILSIQIIARANQAGLRLSAKQLFQQQTIAELAAVAGTTPAIAVQQGPVVGLLPLTPIQRRFFEQELADPHHFNQALLLETRQPLDPARLVCALQQLMEHHDALRLRFVRDVGGWCQTNAAPGAAFPLVQIDLSGLPEAQQAAAIEVVATAVQGGLDLAAGPLVRAALFDLGPHTPGRLLIVVHHLAVDGVSWRILLDDLQTAYRRLGEGAAIVLPPKTTSFKRWAARLVEHAQSEAITAELAYWLAEPRMRVAPLPVDFAGAANSEASARVVPVSLDAEETRALLQEAPAAYHTQINDLLLAALARAYAGWTGAPALLVDLEAQGREDIFDDIDLSRTVGWFTAIVPVLLEVGTTERPGELLTTVKEQLRRIPERGIGYGLLRYLRADTAAEQLRALPQAELSFNYLGQFDQALGGQTLFALAREPSGLARSPRGQRRYLLEINGFVVDGRLRLEWTYSAHVHRRETVERLAEATRGALRELIAHCLAPDAGGYTPSDFAAFQWDSADLDDITRQIDKILGDV